MLDSKIGSYTLGFVIDEEVDAALTGLHNILRTEPGDPGKTQRFEDWLEHSGCWRCELNEFEAYETIGLSEKSGIF